MPTKAKKKTKGGAKGSSKKKSAQPTKSKSAKKAKASPSNGKRNERPQARRSTQDARPKKDKRQLVQERKILRSQSRWLQKALFALAKAEDDQEKLAEVRGEKHRSMAVTVNGSTHELSAVTGSLRDAVMERLEKLRVTLRNEHALMG